MLYKCRPHFLYLGESSNLPLLQDVHAIMLARGKIACLYIFFPPKFLCASVLNIIMASYMTALAKRTRVIRIRNREGNDIRHQA
jgi:hypothetical protein